MSQAKKINGLIQLTEWISKENLWFSTSNQDLGLRRISGKAFLDRLAQNIREDSRRAEIRERTVTPRSKGKKQREQETMIALFVEPVKIRSIY